VARNVSADIAFWAIVFGLVGARLYYVVQSGWYWYLHPEVLSLAPIDGRLYAVGTSFGASASADGGQTWSQLGGGLETVTATQLIDYQNTLLAATSNGIYRFPLANGTQASVSWWLAVISLVVIFGLAGVVLAGFDRWPWSTSRRSEADHHQRRAYARPRGPSPPPLS
jgi:hypothetical protein